MLINTRYTLHDAFSALFLYLQYLLHHLSGPIWFKLLFVFNLFSVSLVIYHFLPKYLLSPSQLKAGEGKD